MLDMLFIVFFWGVSFYVLLFSNKSPSNTLFPFIYGLSFFAVAPLSSITFNISLQKLAFVISFPFVVFMLIKYSRRQKLINSSCLTWVSLYFLVLFLLESIGNIIEGGNVSNLPNVIFNFLLFLISYLLLNTSTPIDISKLFTKYYSISMLLLTPIVIFIHLQNIGTMEFSSGNRISNGMRLGASTDGGLVNVWATSVVLIAALTFFYYNIKVRLVSELNIFEKMQLTGLTICLFSLVTLSLSRSAMLLFIYVALILTPIKTHTEIYILFIIILLLVFYLSMNSSLGDIVFQRFTSIFDSDDASIGGRLKRYVDTSTYFNESPVFGFGSTFPSSFSWVTENTFLFSIIKYGMLGVSNYLFLFFIFLYQGRHILYTKRLLSVVFLLSFFDDTLYLSTVSIYLAFLSVYIDKEKEFNNK